MKYERLTEKVKEIKKALASSFRLDIDYVSNIDGKPKMQRLCMGSVINLINELESENESCYEVLADLKVIIKQQNDRIAELEKENKRLKNRITCKIVVPDDKLEEIKNECLEKVELAKDKLLKQFAERLKEKITTDYINGTREYAIAKIDETLKEFQGG